MKNVINIVNFIRGCDPRADYDLKEAVVEQIKLGKQYKFPMTFLYQYDAMVIPEYVDLLKNETEFEIGLWLEFSRWIVEKVGLEWRAREGYDWDWFTNVDMTQGYTVEERKLLIDEAMRYFKELFGYYPKTVGSWLLDAFSIQYMYEKYDIEMVLVCKEQWATDGYYLWGGYYGEGYFPCKNNMLCPAQSEEEQINVPVFRMCGSDPVDQYVNGMGAERQRVDSMEPVYPKTGGSREWTKWYLKEVFDTENVGINYCQAGQENAFGWAKMKDGYKMQMELFDEIRKQGTIDFEFAKDTGRRFKEEYKLTPISSTDAHKKDRSSLWYNSKFYRSGLAYDNGRILIRDLMVFNDQYRERYLDNITTDKNGFYDNLPVVDCFRWSDAQNMGGMYFEKDGEIVKAEKDFTSVSNPDESVTVRVPTKHGDIVITYSEKTVSFLFPKSGFTLKTFLYTGKSTVYDYKDGKIFCEYENFKYEVGLKGADCEVLDNSFNIIIKDKEAEIVLH